MYYRHLYLVVGLLILAACGSEELRLSRLSDDATILAFGDSLTFGTGAGENNSYPAYLASLSGRRVINAGVPGEVSDQGLRRLSGLFEQYEPELLILCHGGNDILRKQDMGEMQDNLFAMIKLAGEWGIPVVLLAVPKFGLFLSAAPEYRQVAKNSKVIFVENVVPNILRDRRLKSDMIHPNAAGYQLMAEMVYAKLESVGAF